MSARRPVCLFITILSTTLCTITDKTSKQTGIRQAEDKRIKAGLSNLSAMAGRIDLILGMAGHYAISAAVKAMFECEL